LNENTHPHNEKKKNEHWFVGDIVKKSKQAEKKVSRKAVVVVVVHGMSDAEGSCSVHGSVNASIVSKQSSVESNSISSNKTGRNILLSIQQVFFNFCFFLRENNISSFFFRWHLFLLRMKEEMVFFVGKFNRSQVKHNRTTNPVQICGEFIWFEVLCSVIYLLFRPCLFGDVLKKKMILDMANHENIIFFLLVVSTPCFCVGLCVWIYLEAQRSKRTGRIFWARQYSCTSSI